MKHFTKVAQLGNVGNSFQLSFDGIRYLPTDNARAIGFLLFGLRPAGIEFDCNRNPTVLLQAAHAAGLSMHNHATRIQLVPDKTLAGWIQEATSLAPNDKQAMNVYNLIVDNLGPDSAHLKK